MLQFALAENFAPDVVESDGLTWLEAMPARIYHTPMYGTVPMTVDKLERMVKSFKDGVRGQDIATDYDHGTDKAKGNAASGWFKDFAIKPSATDPSGVSLWAAVEFTEDAKQEIADKKWKYFSLEWEDEWMDNAGMKHQDVITGGGITNRPVAKNMGTLPVNFSENQWNELDDETKNRVKKFAEDLKAAQTLLEGNGYTVTNESKEWEHSEPGTGPTPQIGSPAQPDPGVGQPVPRIQGDPSKEDPAIGGGWRRDPLPLDPSDPNAPKGKRDEGGSALTPEELAQLKAALGLKDDADPSTVIETAKTTFSEMSTLKSAVEHAGKERKFAEDYPAQFAEHQRLLAANRDSNARAFSESVKSITRAEGEKFVASGKGLSQLATEKVQEVHRKFSEGTATTEDFEEAIKTITAGGIVDFSEIGSSLPGDAPIVDLDTNTAGGIAANRKLFAEKVNEIQVADKLEFGAALIEAAKKYPDLAAAYRATASA